MLKLHRVKHNLFRIGLIAGVGLAVIGCNQVTEPQDLYKEGDATQMLQPLPTSSNSSLQNLVEKAKEDLAQRFSIPVIQINLIEAVEVEWSDSSLGCPQPDMFYLQVIMPGYRIQLESGGNMYEYHSNRDTYVIYCENSISPNLPNP